MDFEKACFRDCCFVLTDVKWLIQLLPLRFFYILKRYVILTINTYIYVVVFLYLKSKKNLVENENKVIKNIIDFHISN